MGNNIGIIQILKIVASAILAVFSCFLFILVIMFKLGEAFFQIVFNRDEKTQAEIEIIDIAN